MRSWYCYRLPQKSKIVAGISDTITEGFSDRGFVVAPFDRNPKAITTIIPDTRIEFEDWKDFSNYISVENPGFFEVTESATTFYPFPEASTLKTDHRKEVETFIRHHKERGGGKTIAARMKVLDSKISLSDLFNSLCSFYPDACVFAFATPTTGTWIGASPELMLSFHDESLTTMALAGTRPAGTTGEWDGKNIREQQLVADFIVGKIRDFSLPVVSSEPKTLNAGPVEHICTEIKSTVRGIENPFPIVRDLLLALSPTPALCGDHRDESFALIKAHESFRRGYYGGFIGEIISESDANFYVNLRSASISTDKVALYAGSGITAESDAEAEWIETEEKLKTLLNFIEKQ